MLALAGGALFWALRQSTIAPAPVAGAPRSPAATTSAPVPPATAADPSIDASKPAAGGASVLLLPDGTHLPCLNGAHDCEPLQRAWGQWPWSPITGRERSDAGIDWYIHADGSRSTTEMKFRSDLGRWDAVTRVAHPGASPPAVKAQ